MRVILTVFILPCLFGQTASADESGPASTAARTVEAKSIGDEPLDAVPADAARITTAEDPPEKNGVCLHVV